MSSDFKVKLRQASPIILTVLGAIGTIGTAVVAVRSTPKALKLIDEKKEELEKDELTPVEVVETTWKCYVPAATIGVGTIFCIAGVGFSSRRNSAAIAGAYAMLSDSYKKYRQAANQVFGSEADHRIQAEMAKDANIYDISSGYQVYSPSMSPKDAKLLFYDALTDRRFYSTMSAVLNAQYHVNRNLQAIGACSVNDYLSFLGLEEIGDSGNLAGWACDQLIEGCEFPWLDFDNYIATLEDGTTCIVIETMLPFCNFQMLNETDVIQPIYAEDIKEGLSNEKAES